jgi:hypothetical protein
MAKKTKKKKQKQHGTGTKYEDQWNRIQDLDMNPHSYAHLIFDKGAKNIHDGEKTASSTNVAEKTRLSACRKLKLNSCLSSCTSINSKWIKNINIKPKTLKLVSEKAGNNRHRQ